MSHHQDQGDVFAAWVTPGTVTAWFVDSIAAMYEHPDTRALLAGHLTYQSGPHLAVSRTAIVDYFLGTGADWLLCLDSDMSFTPGDVLALVDAADPTDRPIVGGLYVGHYAGRVVPEAAVIEDGRPVYLTCHPAEALVPVDVVGAGFLLVHRGVFTALEALYPRPLPWWEETVVDGVPYGEDFTFCLRAGAAGFPVFVHTGARPGHAKLIPLGTPKGTVA